MGEYIIKPERELDFYVLWSSVCDGPTRWGPRKEIYAHVGTCRCCGHDDRPERFARVDTTGTSYIGGEEGWDDPYGQTFLVLNGGRDSGLIPRARLVEWLEAGCPSAMLDPLEDDQDPADG